MKILKKRILKFFLPVIILTIFTFWKLPLTFYQQDEWLGLGQIFAQGWSHITFGFSPIQVFFADGRPLTRVLGVLLFGNFPFNSTFLALYSVGFHLLNTFLVFLIANKILKKTWFAFISAIFFSVNSVTHQSVTWFGASFGTQPSAFTIFLSIFLFLLYLEENNIKFLYASIFSALISLYFKESSIFLFVFLPLIEIIFKKNFNFKEYVKKYLPFLTFTTLFVLYRLFEMMIIRANSSGLLAGKVFANLGTEHIWQSLFVRSFMYPITSLGYIFIPLPIALKLGYYMRALYYPFITEHSDLISETVILDLLSFLLSFVILFSCYLIWSKFKEYRKAILFSLLLFFFSILPYIVISKTFGYLEPRYYYISSAAASIILSLLVMSLFKTFNNLMLKSTVLCIFIVLIFLNVMTIKNDINKQVIIAKERKSFIAQLYNLKPTLTKDKNIFLVEGNKPRFSDYNKAPFQNGIGYTFMVLYYNSDKIPKELLSEGYLWEWDKQGYKEVEGKGFGYYYDFEELKKDLKLGRFSKDSIVSLYYDSNEKILRLNHLEGL